MVQLTIFLNMEFQDTPDFDTNASKLNFISNTKEPINSEIVSPTALIQIILVGSITAISITALFYISSSSKNKEEGIKAISFLIDYYRSFYYFIVKKGYFENLRYFKGNNQAQCHLYSLSLIFFLWDKPHYRSGTFQNDMLKNLRNVAIPGTGIPLSIFAKSKVLAYWMILIGYPMTACISALYASKRNFATFCVLFCEQLVQPQDWFSFWRLNCRLVTAHSYLTKGRWKYEYDLEDKWAFLLEAEKKQIAVTPVMTIGNVVCKHRNEEGGLGYQSFRNATIGGDWIIQQQLSNGPFLQKMLPIDAPLSTFRIISSSRGGMNKMDENNIDYEDITALSCVWRAGRSKAITDHSAIMFNVDPVTGKVISRIQIFVTMIK